MIADLHYAYIGFEVFECSLLFFANNCIAAMTRFFATNNYLIQIHTSKGQSNLVIPFFYSLKGYYFFTIFVFSWMVLRVYYQSIDQIKIKEGCE